MATPLVVDISHYEIVTDFAAAFRSGIRGVIHKATQGTSSVDPKYHERLEPARSAGLLYGSYHFADASSVSKQVDFFLSTVRPDLNPGLLLALDLEENSPRHGGTMGLDEAKEWLRLVWHQTGQRPVLYSGNLLKQYLNGKADPDLVLHRLWLAEYGSRAILPPGWTSYFLDQYTGDGVGPGPHTVPGISVDGPNPGLDLNYFGGADLGKEWALETYVHDVPPVDDAAPAVPITPLPAAAPRAPVAFVDAPPSPTTATKQQIINASSRLRLNERVANFFEYCFGAGGVSFTMFQQVRDFLIDWRSLGVLLVGSGVYGLIKWNSYKSHQEAQQGRLIPSGMASENSNVQNP